MKVGDRVRVERVTDDGAWSSFADPQRFVGMCGTVRHVESPAKFPNTVNMDNGETGVRFKDDELALIEEVSP